MPAWLFAFIIIATAIGANSLRRRGSLRMPYNGSLGATMSSRTNQGIWATAITVVIGFICWYFWGDLVSLQESILGPDVPLWWYGVGIVGLIIIIGLFRMNKESREKSVHVAEWLIGFTAVAGSLIIFSTWEKEDALCPDKQINTMVPATGMVLDLQSCWDEPFMVLDLRETGIPKLAFDNQSSVLRGRTVDEFAHVQTGYPGAIDGQGRVVFNREEMMRLGLTKLPIFIAPADYQPGAVARFDKATLEALSK
ncbi:MAG: hypothetical protein KBC62_00115 [Candidatus Pacebacteria bacterium]|nr:hypothetical protein [Candidatus Paceibacterota bacterium]MBP9842391.1 hypothetical protein [Candidatus Paceibacterota bacterium]